MHDYHSGEVLPRKEVCSFCGGRRADIMMLRPGDKTRWGNVRWPACRGCADELQGYLCGKVGEEALLEWNAFRFEMRSDFPTLYLKPA